MDTLAGARMTLPLLDPTGRSFAQLDQAERDRLGALLRPLACIDGLIAGTAVSPTDGGRVEADDLTDWLEFIWSEEKADEVGKLTLAQTAEIVAPVMDHYCHVTHSLFDEPESYRPYLAGFSDTLEAAAQWASGFRIGISLHNDGWDDDDKDALTMLLAVFSLLRDEDMPEEMRATSPFRQIPADERERMRRGAVEMLPDIVRALHEHALDLDASRDPDWDEDDGDSVEPYIRPAPKVGRNDPCPCGSGKKYKKCCLDRE